MRFQSRLKPIRVIFSLALFLLTAFVFADIYKLIDKEIYNVILFFQYVPSLIQTLVVFSISSLGFILMTLLALLFGRVYCSFICPLGTLQDIFIFFSRKSGIKKRFRRQKTFNILKYTILALTILALLWGSMLLVNFLDPFSNFGRIMSNIIRPYLIDLNNLFFNILLNFRNYSLYAIKPGAVSGAALIISFTFLLIIIIFSISSGRLYCNTICPVGTLFGLLSRISIFKLSFSKDKCTFCGECQKVCKAGCINVKKQEVDMSRCVACYNCIRACPEAGMKYNVRRKNKAEAEPSNATARRKFLKWTALFTTTVLLSSCRKKIVDNKLSGLIPFKRKSPVTPPGSIGLKHFTSHCTACHLCVSACTTQVLQPSVLEYGLAGLLQPTMNFETSFCNYNCHVCSKVCPSGAIMPAVDVKKQRIQIGVARFIKQNCVVYTKEKDCGACSEHCPTKACNMVPFKAKQAGQQEDMIDMIPHSNMLMIPEVDTHTCIGCGACEYACPVIPEKAIIVDGNSIHLTAFEPKKQKNREVDYKSAFPF